LLRSVFTRELAGSAVIGIGTCPALNGFFGRRLRLSRPAISVQRPASRDAAIAQPGRPLEAAE